MKRKSQDKISNLPDSILLYILSSTHPICRWNECCSQEVEESIYLVFYPAASLDFSDEITDNQAPEQFIDFVNRCLNIHIVKQIERFRLCFEPSDHFWLDAVNWIGFAMRKSLKELHLDFSHRRECYYIKGEIVSDSYVIENLV
ncbi:hypothetical protein NE237_023104 [Protea cynaroides]|uniref:F-box domain-containing protein n=1 Tax=Protea cynaroides TaxID=273540 RepID=A0A9Q0HCA9_9MAGN|nr:hypothetical protein NE237_023104 [Protea cynaroides]